MIGFDNYVKGANAAVAQRRKTGLADQNRVFSRSSVSYNPAAAVRFFCLSSHLFLFVPGPLKVVGHRRPTDPCTRNQDSQTPGSTPAPTPMSSTFGGGRDGPSGAPTPNSAGGGGGRTGQLKKSSKKNAAAEDSETDGRETKKVRTSFGARK